MNNDVKATIDSLQAGDRVDGTLSDGSPISGIFVSYDNQKGALTLTKIGTSEQYIVTAESLTLLTKPTATAKRLKEILAPIKQK